MKTENKRNKMDRLFWLIILLLIPALACEGTSQGNGPPTPTVSKEGGQQAIPGGEPDEECLAGIIPGKSTRAEVTSLLGEPLQSESSGTAENMYYNSPVKYQYNTVALVDGVVNRVSVIPGANEMKPWSAVKAQYGEPEHTAYSYYEQNSRTNAYPQKGLVYIADEDLDLVYIKECFAPLSLEHYNLLYGMFLPQENPFTE